MAPGLCEVDKQNFFWYQILSWYFTRMLYNFTSCKWIRLCNLLSYKNACSLNRVKIESHLCYGWFCWLGLLLILFHSMKKRKSWSDAKNGDWKIIITFLHNLCNTIFFVKSVFYDKLGSVLTSSYQFKFLSKDIFISFDLMARS